MQLDRGTLGTIFYDIDTNKPGGPGVFFLRTPLKKLEPAVQAKPDKLSVNGQEMTYKRR